jgi:hypothetical protein
VLLVRIWLIELPDPALNPEMLGSPVTVQLNTVGITPEVREIPVEEPVHIEGFAGVAAATGIGFTYTT